jgi:hypothetical protein
MTKNLYGEQIIIEVVAGGFILQYPVFVGDGDAEHTETAREVFVSPRKLNQKLKDVISTVSLIAADDAE